MTDDSEQRGDNERNDDQFAVRVKVTPSQADELLARRGLDFGDHPNISPNPDGTGTLNLFVSRAEIAMLQAEGYQIEIGVNLSARARARLTEVGQGDRFEGGRIPPRGLGRKIGGRGPKGDDRPGGAS